MANLQKSIILQVSLYRKTPILVKLDAAPEKKHLKYALKYIFQYMDFEPMIKVRAHKGGVRIDKMLS
jgi:hypothetical protein